MVLKGVPIEEANDGDPIIQLLRDLFDGMRSEGDIGVSKLLLKNVVAWYTVEGSEQPLLIIRYLGRSIVA